MRFVRADVTDFSRTIRMCFLKLYKAAVNSENHNAKKTCSSSVVGIERILVELRHGSHQANRS